MTKAMKISLYPQLFRNSVQHQTSILLGSGGELEPILTFGERVAGRRFGGKGVKSALLSGRKKVKQVHNKKAHQWRA
jgi:hypothetical protein